jgi:hypothetical protein
VESVRVRATVEAEIDARVGSPEFQAELKAATEASANNPDNWLHGDFSGEDTDARFIFCPLDLETMSVGLSPR